MGSNRSYYQSQGRCLEIPEGAVDTMCRRQSRLDSYRAAKVEPSEAPQPVTCSR